MTIEHKAAVEQKYNRRANSAIVLAIVLIVAIAWVIFFAPGPCDLTHLRETGAAIELHGCISQQEKLEAMKFGDTLTDGSTKQP